jgi:hypothetical protein
MNKKKIGLLCLALVLALGTLGVGYAAWTDSILIDGTVETGSVDINAVYFSGCIIYKDVPNESIIEYQFVKDDSVPPVVVWENITPAPVESATCVKIAEAYASPGATEDTVDVTVTGAFPYAYLSADVIIHCTGSVPVIVTYDFDTADSMLVWLWENGYAYFNACEFTINSVSPWNVSFGPPITGPFQMHNCEHAKFWLFLDLPQEDDQTMINAGYTQDDFMDQTWSFTAHFNAIQWNEY